MPPRDSIPLAPPRPIEDISRRGLLITTASAALFAACRSDREEDNAAPVADSAFPRFVDHNLGRTEIKNRPSRIVSFSDGSEFATLLALGAKPVGTFERNAAPLPWMREAGAYDPSIARVPFGANVDFEQIVVWQPDLIIGSSALVPFPPAYERLSAIAPTVSVDFFDWRLALTQVSQCLGEETKAETLRRAIEDKIASTKATLTPYAARKATYIALPDALIFVYNDLSTFGKVAAELGLPTTPNGGMPTNQLSTERAREVEGDLLILAGWNYKGAYGFGSLQDIIAKGLLNGTEAVKNGRVIQLAEEDAAALNFVNVLTVPIILRIFEREYRTAFGG